jgi:hypothetical protein
MSELKERSQMAINEFKKLFHENKLNEKIEINLYKENDDLIELNEIWSEKFPNEGFATKTLLLLIGVCDKYSVDIFLRVLPLRYSPSEYMDRNGEYSSKNKKFLSGDVLKDWYLRHGFVLINNEGLIMIRKGEKHE